MRKSGPAGTALLRLGQVADLSLSRATDEHIDNVLNLCNGNRSTAALVLGLHRRSLQRMLNARRRARKPKPLSDHDFRTSIRIRLKELAMTERSLEERITAVVTEAANVIADLVRADLEGRLKHIVAAKPKSASGTGRLRSRSSNVPAHCLFPDCHRPHKGPRFSFLCDEHMGASKTDKKSYLAAWRLERASHTKTGSKPARSRVRKAQLDEATLTRVLKIVEGNPGLRSEQIYEKLPFPATTTKRALAKLREKNLVKTKGTRRATTYAGA